MVDNVKLMLAAALVVAGIAGFYVLAEMPAVVRVIAVLAGLVSAGGVLWYTAPGRQFFAFSRESVTEARKVVWPTRKETIQMTLVVVAFVVVMAAFLWLVDGLLTWVVQLLMGRSD